MKNIKYITFLFCLFALNFSFAQTALDNGRPANVVAAPVAETGGQSVSTPVDNGGDTFSDQDVPGEQRAEGDDTFYPEDFDFMQNEVLASTSPVEMAQQLNELNDVVGDLRRIIEELRLENQTIREGLSNCCSNSALGLSASDAYLIQNAPNPFNESAEIQYFVPGGLEDVEIRISNVKGELVKSIKIEEAGYGKLEVKAESMSTGSFIYMITVKGEVIDSKVMIITQ